jgi:hypothetical protein
MLGSRFHLDLWSKTISYMIFQLELMLYKQFPIRVSCNACLYCIVALSPSRDSMKTSLDCAREEGRIPGTFRIYGIIVSYNWSLNGILPIVWFELSLCSHELSHDTRWWDLCSALCFYANSRIPRQTTLRMEHRALALCSLLHLLHLNRQES